MKIRNGFVSNSSSSSFVLYGFKSNIKEIQKFFNKTDEEMEDFDFYEVEGKEGQPDIRNDEDDYYIGVHIASGLDEEPVTEFDILKILNNPIIPKLHEVMQRQPKLYAGSASC
jgi:hypothetical protein